MHGQFTWYELWTDDAEAARRFYPAVTGWSMQNWDRAASDNPYPMFAAPDGPMAGLMAMTPQQKSAGVAPMWIAYIEVDSAADTIRRATSLGARVVFGPETMPQVGTFAALTDPQGASFAILEPVTRSPGFDGTPRLGHMSWHELLTTDMDAAFSFYQQLFGWRKGDSMDMGEAGRYQMYGMGGAPFGGMFNRSGRMANVPPGWFLYVNVKDVRKARDAAVRAGAQVVLDVMEVPGGDQVAMFLDPQGACFAVHQAATRTAGAKPATKPAMKPARKKARKKAGTKAQKRAGSGKRPSGKRAVKKRAAGKRGTRASAVRKGTTRRAAKRTRRRR